jgi:hypothetical protein
MIFTCSLSSMGALPSCPTPRWTRTPSLFIRELQSLSLAHDMRYFSAESAYRSGCRPDESGQRRGPRRAQSRSGSMPRFNIKGRLTLDRSTDTQYTTKETPGPVSY